MVACTLAASVTCAVKLKLPALVGVPVMGKQGDFWEAAGPRNVIVLGGGLAGLAAATALAQKGVAVTVVEGRQKERSALFEI